MSRATLHKKYKLFLKRFFLTTAKRIHWYPSCEVFHRNIVTLDSFLLAGRLWCFTGRLSTRMFMLLPRVRKGGTWQLLSWNIVMVGSYKNFSTFKILNFWAFEESGVRKPQWLSSELIQLLTLKRRLTGHCLHFPLWTPNSDFHGARSVHSQFFPLKVVLVVWAQRPTGLQTPCFHHFHQVWLFVPSISVSLKPARFDCNENRNWRLEKVKKRYLVAAWPKKGWLKRTRGKKAEI